jgi:PAS domain S-box-containing protein
MAGFDARAVLDAFAGPVVAADESDRIVYVNAAAERLFAWSAGDLRGELLDVLLPDRLRGQHPRFFRHLLEERARPARVHAIRKDGAELDVELSLGASGPLIVISVRPVREDPGVPADERYRLVFDHAPVGLLHWDAQGVVTDCNDAMIQILGSSKAVAIGLNMLTLRGNPSREKIRELIRQTLEGRVARFEGPYTSQTGQKTTHIQALFAPIHGPSGVIGGLGIVEDVSERKRIEAALARADRMASIGTLAAGVAHEINNPLVYVTLGLELIGRELQRLRAGTGPPAEEEWQRLRTWCSDALDGAERVRSIVRDLRTFSRADDERAGLVDVEKVIDSSINVAMSHIRPRARLVREYQPLLPVLADESRLGQVFLNLLVNAAQAIPEGAPEQNRIVVRTRMGASPQAIVEVEDTGVGIEAWKVERIFEPFWTDKPVGVGTGLGLSIVHGIVSALGGEIQVQSQPGKGSTFRVTLPVQAALNPAGVRNPTPTQAEPGRRPRVLLIDDEAHLGVTLSLGLRDQADVASVRSGVEAVRKLLADDGFDLILCDLMMPDLTGMDVFEQVSRERPALRGRFVFMTGGAVTERARKFLEQVPDQRLDKPFRLEQVEALLRRGVTS